MKTRIIGLIAGACLSIGMGAAPAVAAAPVVLSCTNATFSGITPSACAGGFEGNLLSGSPLTGAGLTALQSLGYTGDGTFLQKLGSLSGNDVNFASLLTGTTYVGIHYGAGSNIGNATSFFRFDAGSGVDIFKFTRNGLSNAVLFSTGSAVPEPATWAMMLIGFGAVGFSMRRRKRVVIAAAA